jgi:hypothetical protein
MITAREASKLSGNPIDITNDLTILEGFIVNAARQGYRNVRLCDIIYGKLGMKGGVNARLELVRKELILNGYTVEYVNYSGNVDFNIPDHTTIISW